MLMQSCLVTHANLILCMDFVIHWLKEVELIIIQYFQIFLFYQKKKSCEFLVIQCCDKFSTFYIERRLPLSFVLVNTLYLIYLRQKFIKMMF